MLFGTLGLPHRCHHLHPALRLCQRGLRLPHHRGSGVGDRHPRLELGMAKGRQLADALGVTRHLTNSRQDVAAGADLADTSAVMDRSFLVMGQIGLFGPELLIPEPVADELATLGQRPRSGRRPTRTAWARSDSTSSRTSGLRSPSCRATSPPQPRSRTRSASGRPPRRPGRHLLGRDGPAPGGGRRPVLDLRRLVSDLSPDHIPGEHLRVDLIRAGRQPQQAIGFLPDGDMVVVNDAEEMVGRAGVEVVVLSTRPTNQGLSFLPTWPTRRARSGGGREPAWTRSEIGARRSRAGVDWGRRPVPSPSGPSGPGIRSPRAGARNGLRTTPAARPSSLSRASNTFTRSPPPFPDRHDELSSRDKLRGKRSRDTNEGGRDDDSVEGSRIRQARACRRQ